ncbi:MAG: hypothetical protein WD009_12025 [Phycisphaeraceae bacterium]
MNDEQGRHVRVEQIDFASVLPVLHVFRSFRMAIHPHRLALALLLVLGLYGLAWLVDAVVERPAPHRAFTAYRLDQATYDASGQWVRTDQAIFETVGRVGAQSLRQLVASAARLELGLARAVETRSLAGGGVVGALGTLLVTLPTWLVTTHPFATLSFALVALLWTALLGGAIARSAAVGAAGLAPANAPASPPRAQPAGLTAALRFTVRRYIWFCVAPLLPLVIVGLVGLLMALAGLALFNVPGLDIVGGVLFGLLLAGGLIAAIVLLGLIAAGHLLWPGLAVEGTDAFDVISRAYNYVFGQPWRTAGYALITIIYGSLAYLFVALVLSLALVLTHLFVGAWVFGEAEPGVSRFDAMFGPPGLMHLAAPARFESLGVTGSVAAGLIQAWTLLLAALGPAFAVSFYFCGATWVYLLLRRASDGTSFEDVDIDNIRSGVDADEAAETDAEHREP